MVIESSVISDIGKIRRNNEDNFFFNGLYRKDVQEKSFYQTKTIEGRSVIYAVCDGMGGEDYGEVASMCVASALEILKSNKWSGVILEEYINRVQKDILEKGDKLLAKNMGSTLALLYLEDNTAHIVNVGDSRIYIYRHGKLKQLTKDHTQARILMENGLLREDEAGKHISAHILTRYLGTGSGVTVKDLYMAEDVKLCKNDVFLICSDGLTGMLSDNKIEEYFYGAAEKGTGQMVQKLCDKALEAGGKDNITCIVAKVLKKNGLFVHKKKGRG